MYKTHITPRHRIFSYDLLKALAAFMVCFYHFEMLDMGYTPGEAYIPNFNKAITVLCAMCVPLFFMVNGALMLRKTYTATQIVRRTVRILLLYWIWNTISAFVWNCQDYGIQNVNFLEVIKQGSTGGLWFLRTTAILTLLQPIFKKIYDRKSKVLLTLAMSAVLVFPFLYNYGVLVGHYFQIPLLQGLPRTGAFTMYSVLYFLMGKALADYIQEGRNQTRDRWLAVGCLLLGWLMVLCEVTVWTNLDGTLFDGVNASFPTIGALLMAGGTFYLSFFAPSHAGTFSKVISSIGSNSMGVYVMHLMFVITIRQYIKGPFPMIVILLLTAAVLAVTTGISAVGKKILGIRYLFQI